MDDLIINPTTTQSQDFFPLFIDIFILSTAVISTLVSLLIPCLYYMKKQCQQHPTVLIANISLLQSIANFNIVLMAIDIFTYENFIHITNIFHALTFNIIKLSDSDTNDKIDFCIYNYCVYMLVELLSISFHICYSIDLFITIKFPFFTGKKRRKYYYLFAVILPLITLANSFQEADQICQNQLAKESIYKVPKGFLITLIIFCVISLGIVLMSLFQKSRSKIRKEYIHHHRFILCLLVLFWIAPIWSNILLRFDMEDDPYFKVLNKISFFCIIASTGIINIARMGYDKFLRHKVKNGPIKIIDMICLRSEDNQRRDQLEQQNQKTEKVNDEVWNLPLSQAMNQFQSQQIVNYIIQVVCQACNAHKIKRSTMRQSHFRQSNTRFSSNITNERQSTMLYDSVYRNTVVVQDEVEQAQKTLMTLFKAQPQKYEKMNPNQASIVELKQLCKKKRRFNMVCMTPVQVENDESQSQTRSHKTVHIKGNLIKQQKIKRQEINLMLSIKVTSYSHRIFQCLRQYDRITEETISESLNVLKNMENIKKAKESLGASGSFFFFSFDHKLVIKTIPEEQKNRFIEILPYYFDHIRSNEESLFARTYGIFSIQIQGISKIYFIMMENTFRNLQQAHIKYKIYDLKGSTVQRYVKNQNAQVLKDINYFKSQDCFIYMSKQNKIRLTDQITRDIDMLKSHNIMDYSLLLAVGRSKRGRGQYNRQERRITNCRYITQMQQVTKRVYSISIIDYLQQFNLNKKMELWLKRIFKGGGDISSIETQKYYERFVKLINRIVIVFNVKIENREKISQTV